MLIPLILLDIAAYEPSSFFCNFYSVTCIGGENRPLSDSLIQMSIESAGLLAGRTGGSPASKPFRTNIRNLGLANRQSKVIYICRYLLIQIIPGRLSVRYRLAKKTPTSQIILISVFALFGYLSISYYTVALKYGSKVGYARCKILRSKDLALIRIYFLATLQPSDRIPGLRPSFNKKEFLLHDKR